MFKGLITKQKVARNRRGFTILELVVVLLIISILAGFLYQKFSGREQASKIASTYSTILRHYEAGKSYLANHGTTDFTNATTANLEADGLITAGATNPWGNAFTITTTVTTFNVATTVDTAATATAIRDQFTAQGYTSGGTGKIVSITF
jgi:prepilin-type N-terminal cleavage/methylation domain-containing protein